MAGATYGEFYALDAATGEELWSYEAAGLSAAPVVAAGVLYGASELAEYIFALDAASGEELWTETIEDFRAYSLSVVDGILYGQLTRAICLASMSRLVFRCGSSRQGDSPTSGFTRLWTG